MKHLLHIGFPKTGSTYLQQWFARHPQLQYEQNGICGFGGATGILAWSNTTPDVNVEWLVTSHEAFVFPLAYGRPFDMEVDEMLESITHTDAVSEAQGKVGNLMQQMLPEAQVLIVTRGYDGMLHSIYYQYLRVGGTLSFNGFFDRYYEVLLEWLNYDHVIRTYQDNFGADNVLILPFELLREDESQFQDVVRTWLQVDEFPVTLGVVNAAYDQTSMNFILCLARVVKRLGMMLPINRRRVLFPWFTRRFVDSRVCRMCSRLIGGVLPDRIGPRNISPNALRTFAERGSLLPGLPFYDRFEAAYLLDSPEATAIAGIANSDEAPNSKSHLSV